jgi:hypothetical protein
MLIFLDESGDLGFDFEKKKTTSFFVITLLVVPKESEANLIRQAVKRTIKRKIHGKSGKRKTTIELKGFKTGFAVKKHFWEQTAKADFSILGIALNKRRVNSKLAMTPDRLYNYLARFVIDKLDLAGVTELNLKIDKSKSKREIEDFNNYLSLHLKAVINPSAILDIDHALSHEEKAIQAVDLFAWGIFRKYENSDCQWYDIFKGRISFETKYLP